MNVNTGRSPSSFVKPSMKPCPTTENVASLNDAPPLARGTLSAAAKSAATNRAIALLVIEHGRYVRTLARRFLRNQADADDVAQHVWIRVARHLNEFRGACQIQSWLFRITKNCVTDHYRKQQRKSRPHEVSGPILDVLADVLPDRQQDALSAMLDREQIALVHRYLADVPAQWREGFLLMVVGGLNAREVSAVLGIQEGTVKSRVHRVRLYLRKRMCLESPR